MSKRESASDPLAEWRAGFLAAARSDEYEEWRDDLECYENPAEAAREREEAMVALLTAIISFFRLDGATESRMSEFLRKQTYRRSGSPARYELYFCGSQLQEARVFVDRLDEVDLADIHGTFGFADVGVVLRGGGRFEEGEADELERAIRSDFGYDFADDEVEITFERTPTCVMAHVRET